MPSSFQPAPATRRNPPGPRTDSEPNIIGASPRMRRILHMLPRIATTESTVLLIGESGTGKELVARSIHLQSRRSQEAFVAVNVGAIPETLVESELFGYVRGAFTGATADRRGLVEAAHGGTLFLDEVGDMPLDAQVKLLRTLALGELRRLGDTAARTVDVRVIAATHKNLREMVAAGTFREDLYYRLNVIQIEIPPLRERRLDIGLLVAWFLERVGEREGRRLAISPEAAALLERYDYPGNVRELENAIEHAVAVTEGNVILPVDLPGTIRAPRMLPARGVEDEASPPARDPAHARDAWSLADVEREHIQRVLGRHRGNATAAARQLGISRTTLWRKLRQYGLRRTGE